MTELQGTWHEDGTWTPPFDPDYTKHAERCQGDTYPCFICGRPAANPKHYARIDEGIAICTDEHADAHPAGDTGYYPVGRECYRRLPANVKAMVSTEVK